MLEEEEEDEEEQQEVQGASAKKHARPGGDGSAPSAPRAADAIEPWFTKVRRASETVPPIGAALIGHTEARDTLRARTRAGRARARTNTRNLLRASSCNDVRTVKCAEALTRKFFLAEGGP